ncbi:Uncharacterized protein PCOAH_00014180 [Plasmodium coatneyi]|uniref:Uncharacterized protein n=1 Tax=Plasmodium coatneyi TaxID=208452 RepID=A0A1B1DWF9_9APIC|nr:Uncharacterized protein PCOAH_00014180 [Plasmodium coatneyi]ANQ07141.1 Uncharacterized protein PCOAH_00014180 [Plasmodium coatneyi]
MRNDTAAEGTPVEDAGKAVPSNRSKDHNESCAEQAGDSPKKTDLNEMNKMNKPMNGFAANIAMEALAKASKFISKNERVQKEYSGVGLNDEEDKDSREHLDVNGHNAHAGGAKVGPNKNFLHGAHPILPGIDKELQEKLKNRRCNA